MYVATVPDCRYHIYAKLSAMNISLEEEKPRSDALSGILDRCIRGFERLSERSKLSGIPTCQLE